jgi:hypothetical protein
MLMSSRNKLVVAKLIALQIRHHMLPHISLHLQNIDLTYNKCCTVFLNDDYVFVRQIVQCSVFSKGLTGPMLTKNNLILQRVL